jgi:hypothetical protein
LEITHGGEGLGRHFVCPPRPNQAQHIADRPSEINSGTRLSRGQNHGTTALHKTLSLISFIPCLFHEAERERVRAMAIGLEGERATVERVYDGALSREPESVSGGAQGPLPGLR